MGVCCSDDNNRDIETYLASQEHAELEIKKLLFLGPGGSGKSTIFKQLQLLHAGGFSKDQLLSLRSQFYCQIIEQMKQAIQAYHVPNPPTTNKTNDPKPQTDVPSTDESEPNNKVQEYNEEMISAIKIVNEHSDPHQMNDDIANAIKHIWSSHDTISAIFTQKGISNKILVESTEYFWNEIDRIRASDYCPNEVDIIKLRSRTVGIIEKRIRINNVPFLIVDVGGQKNERKKWIKCFDECRAVVFVVGLSSYNEVMFEDANKNRMIDALEIFDFICNHKLFIKTDMILFLNKTDLYRSKIIDIPITQSPAFKDFETEFKFENAIHLNPCDFEQTTCYIQSKFEALNQYPKSKQVYTHLTCATDKQNIQNVFNDVQHMIVCSNLTEVGVFS